MRAREAQLDTLLGRCSAGQTPTGGLLQPVPRGPGPPHDLGLLLVERRPWYSAVTRGLTSRLVMREWTVWRDGGGAWLEPFGSPGADCSLAPSGWGRLNLAYLRERAVEGGHLFQQLHQQDDQGGPGSRVADKMYSKLWAWLTLQRSSSDDLEP